MRALFTIDPLSHEIDETVRHLAVLGRKKTGNGLERRGLAGAVVSENRHDLPLAHLQRHPFQHQNDVVVDNLDIVDKQ